LNLQIVDLFSSLTKQPMSTQVAVIDALEDFVIDWLFTHSLTWYVMVLIAYKLLVFSFLYF